MILFAKVAVDIHKSLHQIARVFRGFRMRSDFRDDFSQEVVIDWNVAAAELLPEGRKTGHTRRNAISDRPSSEIPERSGAQPELLKSSCRLKRDTRRHPNR